jgi:hypothetical protein
MLDIVHSFRWSETRLSESCPELGEDLIDGYIEGAVESASAGAAMAAAAEVLGNLRYVSLSLAANTEAKLTDDWNLA